MMGIKHIAVSTLLFAMLSLAPAESVLGQDTSILERAAQLRVEAERAQDEGTGGLRRAASLWSQAAALYEEADSGLQEASARRNAARAFEALGQTDSALAHYGRALVIEDSGATAQLVDLMNESPVLDPSRDLADEARFIRAVKALVSMLLGGSDIASDIESTDEAMDVLENMSVYRTAVISIRSTYPRLFVEYRRWKYRHNPNVPWTPVTTDTTVSGPPVTYQFRYTDPRTRRDTVVTWPCADGCTVELPVRGN